MRVAVDEHAGAAAGRGPRAGGGAGRQAEHGLARAAGRGRRSAAAGSRAVAGCLMRLLPARSWNTQTLMCATPSPRRIDQRTRSLRQRIGCGPPSAFPAPPAAWQRSAECPWQRSAPAGSRSGALRPPRARAACCRSAPRSPKPRLQRCAACARPPRRAASTAACCCWPRALHLPCLARSRTTSSRHSKGYCEQPQRGLAVQTGQPRHCAVDRQPRSRRAQTPAPRRQPPAPSLAPRPQLRPLSCCTSQAAMLRHTVTTACILPPSTQPC